MARFASRVRISAAEPAAATVHSGTVSVVRIIKLCVDTKAGTLFYTDFVSAKRFGSHATSVGRHLRRSVSGIQSGDEQRPRDPLASLPAEPNATEASPSKAAQVSQPTE